MNSSFTVFYDDPFWVGILERTDEKGYWIGRHVFGAEPSNAEIWSFASNDFPAMRIELVYHSDDELRKPPIKSNRKRAQREAARQQRQGLRAYTHQALQDQYKARKEDQLQNIKTLKEKNQERRFLMKQQKKKEKTRGH